MNRLLLASVFSFSLFNSHPEISPVPVANLFDSQSITGIYLVIPDKDELTVLSLNSPIEPGETEVVHFPWGFVNRVIFTTDLDGVYFESSFPASSHPDTIGVSLALKEFGGTFDRIHGTRPIILTNETLVPISTISAEGPSLSTGNALNGQMLMPGESLRLWVDTEDACFIGYSDVEGYPGEGMFLVANADTVYSITSDRFFGNGTTRTTVPGRYEITVVNCISSERIQTFEVFDDAGFSVGYYEFDESPLETWDRAVLHTDFPPAFVTCTDGIGRTYTLEEPDSATGCFIFDLLSLDFDFSFPEGR